MTEPAAVKSPPKELEAGYTMNAEIPLDFFFVDDTNGTGTHYSYGDQYIKSMLEGAKKHITRLGNILTEELNQSITEASVMRMRINKSDWIYVALMKYKELIDGKCVAVVGSSEPRIEAIAAAFGAASITTIEYNKLTYGSGSVFPIQTVAASEFEYFYKDSSSKFDLVISISSIEHDGLGRYGDPLNPDADLAAMHKIKSILRPEGSLILSVPIGPDVTVFNLHRRYGKVRLPVLLEGWKVVDRIPWNEKKLTDPANWRQTFEPIIILQKKAMLVSDQSFIPSPPESINIINHGIDL